MNRCVMLVCKEEKETKDKLSVLNGIISEIPECQLRTFLLGAHAGILWSSGRNEDALTEKLFEWDEIYKEDSHAESS